MNMRTSTLLMSNPSWRLYSSKKDRVDGVRRILLDELNRSSKTIGQAGERILYEKINSSPTPLMGELFPWIIQDITGIDTNTIEKIAVGWLAIYSYVIFLDSHIDEQITISPENFIAGSLFAKIGLLRLHKFVVGSAQESSFDNAFDESAKFQFLDFRTQHQHHVNKENHALGKNKILLTCASALAASSPEDAAIVMDFSKSILLTLQLLDDLSDWKDDSVHRNMTILLSASADLRALKNTTYTDHEEILRQLVISGALGRVLEKILALISNSISIIDSNRPGAKNTDTYFFFNDLSEKIESLINFEKLANKILINKHKTESSQIIKDLETRIRIIAQSS